MKLRRCNTRNTTFISYSTLITASLFSFNCQATAPPVDYDEWSLTATGYIDSTCPAGYSCGFEVDNPGFQQQRLVGNGDIFFRTIIDEGDYTSVSLIRAFNRKVHQSPVQRNGLVNKQNINSSQTMLNEQTNFSSEAILYTGWAGVAGIADLRINQSVDEVFRKAGAGGLFLEGQFNATTNIGANYDHYGKRTGLSFATDQLLEEPGQYRYGTYYEIDSQVFSMRGLEGDMLTTAGSLTLNNKTINWSEDDKLWGFAIGQNFHHSRTTGAGDSVLPGYYPAPGSQDLSVMFESYDNRSDDVGAANYFSYFQTDTSAWPTIFGSPPELPGSTGRSSSVATTAGPTPTLVTGLFTPTAVGPEQADGRDAPLDFGLWNVAGGTLNSVGVLSEPIALISDGETIPMQFEAGDDGSILPDCGPNATCEAADIIAPGMIQRVVRDSNGERYIQTILTDLDTGFSSESFVSLADTGLTGRSRNGLLFSGGAIASTIEDGIALRMVLSEDSNKVETTSHINTEVVVNTGWAARTGTPNIAISQDVNETGLYNSPYDQHFAYQGNRDANGNSIGSLVDIDQSGTRFINVYYGYQIPVLDTMKFAHRSRSGNLQSDTGGTGVINRNDPGFTWQAGDAISVTWLSNTSTLGQSSGFGGLFYDNLVDDLGYSDVGWRFSNYNGVGSDWVSSAFGIAPN